jgi:hypothetical protein
MECQYCKNTFSTKTSLNTHQKTAKYCLAIRNLKLEGDFVCRNCDKIFGRNTDLQRHNKTCKKKIYDNETRLGESEKKIVRYKEQLKQKDKLLKQKDKLLKQKDIQIQILQDKLENIAIKAVSKPINIHQTNNNHQKINTMINNLVPISDKHFEENVKYLTIDHIKRGAEGYAEYALEFPLKNRVACVDYSRKKIKYKEEGKEGEEIIISDPGMSKLSMKLFSAINDRNIGLISKHTNELTQLIFVEPDKDKDEEGETKELSDKEVEKSIKSGEVIVRNIFQLRSQLFDVRESAKGSKTDLYHQLVNHVCSKTAY